MTVAVEINGDIVDKDSDVDVEMLDDDGEDIACALELELDEL